MMKARNIAFLIIAIIIILAVLFLIKLLFTPHSVTELNRYVFKDSELNPSVSGEAQSGTSAYPGPWPSCIIKGLITDVKFVEFQNNTNPVLSCIDFNICQMNDGNESFNFSNCCPSDSHYALTSIINAHYVLRVEIQESRTINGTEVESMQDCEDTLKEGYTGIFYIYGNNITRVPASGMIINGTMDGHFAAGFDSYTLQEIHI